MNSFDAVVYLGLVIAMVTGFNTGLVRSAVTILAYLVAVPIAIWAMSALSPPANGKVVAAFAQNGLVFFGVFLFAGMALGKLARVMVDEATGLHAGPVDRLPAQHGFLRRGMAHLARRRHGDPRADPWREIDRGFLPPVPRRRERLADGQAVHSR